MLPLLLVTELHEPWMISVSGCSVHQIIYNSSETLSYCVVCADGHVLGKHKHQSKKQLSDASSSDEEPKGKRSKYDELSRATKEERPAKRSSHHDGSSDGYKRSRSTSSEAERRRHKDRKRADDVITEQKVEKCRGRQADAASQERSRDTGGKHSASSKRHDVHCRDNDRSRSTSVDVERRHRKDRSDSRDHTGSSRVEKQQDVRAKDEHAHHGGRKLTRHDDEDRRGSHRRRRRSSS